MSKRLALLNKYNKKGSRYTYFPNHSLWDNNLSLDDFKNDIAENANVDVYVHIPFCYSLCNFCGCNIKIVKNRNENTQYIKNIANEWRLYNKNLNANSIYIGGGTPNFLSSFEIENIINLFNPSKKTQITIELDPRIVLKDDILAYKEMGITRLSFGIQDFNELVLKNVNRQFDQSKIIEIINFASEIGFHEINLDFIYGLDFQTKDSFLETLSMLKNINATSISLFPFAKVPWLNNFRPSTEISEHSIFELNEIFLSSHDLLKTLGFNHVGMGFFSKLKTNYKRNIMGFTPVKEDILIGLGVSAISTSPLGHMQNEKIYEKYMLKSSESITPILKTHRLTGLELKRQQFFERVICSNEITSRDIEEFKTKSFDQYIEDLLKDEILIKNEDGFTITPDKRIFHKTILQLFDPNFNVQ